MQLRLWVKERMVKMWIGKLEIIKLDTMEKAQAAPSPATIFSLFYNGEFITTDLSVCLDNHFDKILKNKKLWKKYY